MLHLPWLWSRIIVQLMLFSNLVVFVGARLAAGSWRSVQTDMILIKREYNHRLHMT